MFSNLGAGEYIVIFTALVFVVLPLVLCVIALVDILKNNFEGSNKVVWILVVILLPLIGSILYFIIGRSQKVSLS